MPLCCLKCGWIPGLRPQLASLHIPPIGSQLVHALSIADPLKLIRAGCRTRFRGLRSLTFAACGNKTLFSIIFTTSPLAKSWIRACIYHLSGKTTPFISTSQNKTKTSTMVLHINRRSATLETSRSAARASGCFDG